MLLLVRWKDRSSRWRVSVRVSVSVTVLVGFYFLLLFPFSADCCADESRRPLRAAFRIPPVRWHSTTSSTTAGFHPRQARQGRAAGPRLGRGYPERPPIESAGSSYLLLITSYIL